MLTKPQKILLSFMHALITLELIYLAYKLVMYLYSVFGLMAVIGIIAFIGTWCVWYVIFND